MTRPLAAVLFILLGWQDPPADVEALIQELKSDEIILRERAMDRLVRLGSRVVPKLRERMTSGDESFIAHLRAVIRSIERHERIASILAPPNRVTLKAVEAPVEDVLAELYLQTGHRVRIRDLYREKKVSVDVSNVEPWEAFDALGANLGLSWRVCYINGFDVILFSAKRDSHQRLRFKSGGLTAEVTAIDRGCLVLVWDLYHGPARPFRLLRFEVDELRDDVGTNLSLELPPSARKCRREPPDVPEKVRDSVVVWESCTRPAEESKCLARVKGRLIVETTLDKDGGERLEMTIPVDLRNVPIN